MINQQLLDYIKSQLQLGLTKEKISSDLLANGWTAQDIEEGFRTTASPVPTASYIPVSPTFINANTASPVQTNTRSNTKLFLTIFILFLLAGGGASAYFFRNDLVKLPILKDIFPSENKVVNTEIPVSNTKENKQFVDNKNIKNRFIYIAQVIHGDPPEYSPEIEVSDVDGGNLVVLKKLDKYTDSGCLYSLYKFPSPKGTYFLANCLYNKNIITNIVNINGKTVFSLSDKEIDVVRNSIVRWSSDEHYFAFIRYNAVDYSESEIVVYDVLLGKQIFHESIGPLKQAKVGDPIETDPKVIWGENDNTLYLFNDLGIKIIKDFETNPTVKFIETKVPCLGIAPHNNEFYCAGRMNTIFSGGVKKSATSSFIGSVFKYTLTNDTLSNPESVTSEPVEGEYAAELTFLDDEYLAFIPLLGPTSIINIKNGSIENETLDSLYLKKNLGIFGIARGVMDSADREKTIPIVYKGR